MNPGPHSIEDLVLAISEGKAIDWDALGKDGSPGFQNKLSALRVLEGIARVHRSATPGGTPPVVEMPESLGGATTRWGHLELLEHLASGAFGDVHRAWDSGLDREVALKLLRRSPDADADADEALEEGRLLAKVRHPNVVTVYGAARFDGRAGVWMEFVHGRTLADVVAQDGPLPPAKVASIGVALCHALSAVHGASLVHRDVKPHNVMVGEGDRTVLMDFGAGSAIRHTGLQRAGTPLYLAPEVAEGEPATVQSDVYSLGATLRYLLTGHAHAHTEIRPTTRVERRLLSILAGATAARLADRFQSAAAFAGALEPLTKSPRPFVATWAGTVLALALALILWAALRTLTLDDAHRRAMESSWQTAIPARAPLTPDQGQIALASAQGTFSLHGVLVGTTAGASLQQALVTLDPRSGDTRVWSTYSPANGYADSLEVWADNSLMTYVWNDKTCECASLRSVDRAGRIRTLLSGPDIVTIWSGATTSRLLPILIGRNGMQFELALVDTETGAERVLRTLTVDPRGFSLSADGRFVAFDMPRPEPAGTLDIIIHEISTSREWSLIDKAGDRSLPVWSPGGDQLFYVESLNDTTALQAVRVSGGHRASEPALLRRDLGRPSAVGFLDSVTFAYWLGTGRSDVMVVEAAPNGTFHGQKPRRIGQGSMMPALSPDGRWLAWTDFTPRTGGMRVTGRDGRAFRTFEPSLDVQILPAWSDDSTQLAFWDVSRLGAILKIVDVEIGTTREVMRVTHPRIWRRDLALEWIPGGRELLITPDAKPLVVLDIISGKQREFHVPPEADMMDHPFISRDGHWLAFCDRDQHGPIHVVPLSTSGPSRTLPVSAAESLLGWWPDGSLLEVHELTDSRPSSRVELWRRPLDGAPAEPLGITGTNIIYVTVSSDARRIAYSTQTFGQELWLVKPVGPD